MRQTGIMAMDRILAHGKTESPSENLKNEIYRALQYIGLTVRIPIG